MNNPSKKTELLRKALADGLSETGFLSLYNLGKLRKLNEGGRLFKEGDRSDTLFLVVNGKCRIEPSNSNNLDDKIFFREGDWIGELLFFQTPLRMASVAAVRPTIVLVVNGKAFRALPSETQSFILKNLNDQAVRRLRAFAREHAQSHKISTYLTGYIRKRHEESVKGYEQSEILQNILKNIPRLPIYVTRLVQLLLNENASIREVARLAKQDPSLVSQILRTVNSTYYALRTKIADLNHAILYLGFNEVYQIVVSGGLQKTMPSTREFQDLHQHSVTISHLTYEICQNYDQQKSSVMSTIGVLHDIGKSVVYLLKKQNPKWQLFVEMLDPAKIGSLLLSQWNIPEMISETIQFQHCPEFMASSELTNEHKDCIAILYLAHLCSDMLEGIPTKPADHPFLRDYMGILKLHDLTFTEFLTSRILPSLEKKVDTLPSHLRALVLKYSGDQPGWSA